MPDAKFCAESVRNIVEHYQRNIPLRVNDYIRLICDTAGALMVDIQSSHVLSFYSAHINRRLHIMINSASHCKETITNSAYVIIIGQL